MTTTDSNGLIQYQTTDNVVPLQTTLNAISSSVSTSLNSTVRTFKVANDTERNALATSRPPTATNPLIVFNSASGKGYHEINTGSGWSRWIPIVPYTTTTATPAAGYSTTIPLVCSRYGNIVTVTGAIRLASGNITESTVGTTYTLPESYRPSALVEGAAFGPASTTTGRTGWVWVNPDGTVGYGLTGSGAVNRVVVNLTYTVAS